MGKEELIFKVRVSFAVFRKEIIGIMGSNKLRQQKGKLIYGIYMSDVSIIIQSFLGCERNRGSVGMVKC